MRCAAACLVCIRYYCILMQPLVCQCCLAPCALGTAGLEKEMAGLNTCGAGQNKTKKIAQVSRFNAIKSYATFCDY